MACCVAQVEELRQQLRVLQAVGYNTMDMEESGDGDGDGSLRPVPGLGG